MTRCAVCGKTISHGNAIDKGAVMFHDLTRDKVMYRHASCNQDDYKRAVVEKKPFKLLGLLGGK